MMIVMLIMIMTMVMILMMMMMRNVVALMTLMSRTVLLTKGEAYDQVFDDACIVCLSFVTCDAGSVTFDICFVMCHAWEIRINV